MTQYVLDNTSTRHAFDLFDYQKKGIVNIEEVLQNMSKLGYDKTHPELFDLVASIDEESLPYEQFELKINQIMNEKEEDSGLQRMYDLLIYNPSIKTITYDVLKKISKDIDQPLSEYEINYLLTNVGNGTEITLEDFVEYMKSN